MKAKAVSSLPVVYKAAVQEGRNFRITGQGPHKSHKSGRDWGRWNRQFSHPPNVENELLKSK